MTAAARYRKKPVEIEAQRLGHGGDIVHLVTNWLIEHNVDFELTGDGLVIKTLEGNMLATWGDWIIRGVEGEFYPCKPDIFQATYEPVVSLP